MASKKKPLDVHIAVVGMSGPPSVRGNLGVGKSCLCNRFVAPGEDDFHTSHSSVLSQSDFGGRVVNNDQFLYWGQVTKEHAGVELTFRVIEHTELMDDASFSVFKGSFHGDYVKRCAETKLQSPEKVAYICRDQLGDEEGFPRQVIPKGKFRIDGFLLAFDVSEVKGRSITAQREFLQNLHAVTARTSKPVVLVATKCDAVSDRNLNELKEFARKRKLVLTECSANLGVNVDSPFFKLASMISKRLPQAKLMTYQEALVMRCERLDALSQRYDRLLEATVAGDWGVLEERLRGNSDFQEYVKLAGTLAAKKKFGRHIMQNKPQYENCNLSVQKHYFMPESTEVDDTLHAELLKASHCNRASCAGVSSHVMDTIERSPEVPRRSTLRKKLPVRPPKPQEPYQQTSGSSTYCELPDMTSTQQTQCMGNISRLYTMKAAGLCRRWMGTMHLQDGGRRFVVLTAIKVRDDLHWNQFVIRSLELPSSDHIAGVMGIASTEGEPHLVQEHFMCETLENRLTKARHAENRMSISEIVSHIGGILEGLEMLHAYDFLHPGLSTKKILLTKQGVCKFYDYCLAEDAAKIASRRRTKTPISLNHFAPEVIRCGEYTKDSDIWSTGIVIYEILTGDKQPFPTEYRLDAVAAVSLPKYTKAYPELRNGTLWRCWTQSPSLRPTMKQLRTTYKKVFESVERGDYETPDVNAYLSICDDEKQNSYGTLY